MVLLWGRPLWWASGEEMTWPLIKGWKRAEPSSAHYGSFMQRAELGSARPSSELAREARLGSFLAREPARRANEPTHKCRSAL
jgi:hypothetical protein